MIKTEAPIMQTVFQDEAVDVAPERRAFLACKGQRLYSKYCGTKGRGICAESFAEYHIWRGEWGVARDFLIYLNIQVDLLCRASPYCARVGSAMGHDRTSDRSYQGFTR